MAEPKDIEGRLFLSGCDEAVLSEFRLLFESNRYPGKKLIGPSHGVQTRVAALLVGLGGERRDRPLYELCHFIAALAQAGFARERDRLSLLLGLPYVTPASVRHEIETRLGEESVETSGGIVHRHGSTRFLIRFNRMPFLIAVYELLSLMDGCAYYHQLSDILDTMLAGAAGEGEVRRAANAIAQRLREYRRAHFDWGANREAFSAIAGFLNSRLNDGCWCIDDEALIDFWIEQSAKGRFREYKTAFDAFVRLVRSLERSRSIASIEASARLGQDLEAGEVDPVDGDLYAWSEGGWRNPLLLFDEEELRGINFFKAKSERRPMELLMHYGPDAMGLLRGFLRLEAFAPIQSAIGNDLRFGRGQDKIHARLDLHEALSYRDHKLTLEGLSRHVSDLMEATLHILLQGDGELVATAGDFPAVAERSERRFRAMKRKGFQIPEAAANDAVFSAFERAAEALPTILGQLRSILERLEALDLRESLDTLFEADKRRFHRQFCLLYEDRP